MTTCQVRFMDNNYHDSATLISSTAAASGFPVTNTYNPLRSKVYKPQGTFLVTASNNKVYFTGGSAYTASLTVGSYTGTTLAAEVQARLNALDSGWTCTYDTSAYKFFIDRSSGTKVLRLTQTTNAAWSLLGYLDTIDITAGVYSDAVRIHSQERFIWDMGLPMPVTAFAAIGPISEVFGVSASATVKLYGNNLNDWSAPPMDVTLTRTEAGIFGFPAGDTTFRYFCLDIIDLTNPGGAGVIQIGHIYLGDHLTLTTSNVATGFSKKYVDPSGESVSESGVRYYNTRPKYREFSSMEIQVPAASERRLLEQLWYDNGLHTSFYVAVDPLLGVSASYDEMTFYCNFAGEPEFRHVIRDYYSMSFELREAV